MKIGTKTLLFGTHQVVIHPWYVYKAWRLLFGRRPKLHELAAIVTHDWGYWGCPDIDGGQGEAHPFLPAWWWSCKFGGAFGRKVCHEITGHSGFYAKAIGAPLSRLYCADKLGISLYPRWLYLLLGRLSGEIEEDRQRARDGRYGDDVVFVGFMPRQAWLLHTQSNMALMAFAESKRFD